MHSSIVSAAFGRDKAAQAKLALQKSCLSCPMSYNVQLAWNSMECQAGVMWLLTCCRVDSLRCCCQHAI